MGGHDLVCYLRKNGQYLRAFEHEEEFCNEDGESVKYDLNEKYSTMVNYNTEDHMDDSSEQAMVIIHSYNKDIDLKSIGKNFFTLQPVNISIYPEIEYCWDDWSFDIGGNRLSMGESMRLNNFELPQNVFRTQEKWLDSNLNHYYVAISPDSLNYILKYDYPTVPIELMEEIRGGWNIDIDQEKTVAEVIEIVRDHFAYVRKYLQQHGVIKSKLIKAAKK